MPYKKNSKITFFNDKNYFKNNLNDHMIFKNKSMFGRKYLTEVNVYFPYHNIFLSASHTLQKPQTKDNGFGSYFFFQKKGRLQI